MHDYYRAANGEAEREINSRTDEYILGVDEEEYTAYLFEKWSLMPIERDEDREILIERVNEWKDVRDPDWGMIRRETVQLRITYPIVHHDKIDQVLEVLPTRQRSVLPRFEYDRRQSVLILLTDMEPSAVEREVEGMEWWLQARNDNIRGFNPRLRDQIAQAIRARRQTIEQRVRQFDDLLQKVSIPLKAKPAAQWPVVDLSIRREIKPILRPPQAKRPEELVLEKDKVLAVIEIIDRTGRQFENAPSSYTKLKEEDLRSIILSHLNTIFEGSATGETFSKKGKTDIYLVVQKGGILVAECKYWMGPAKYAETIDQLFRYLTWRHNYGIVVTFSRNVGFTNVLDQAEQATRNHPTFRGVFRKVGDSHFESVQSFPDDDRKTVEIHHLLYNLYAG